MGLFSEKGPMRARIGPFKLSSVARRIWLMPRQSERLLPIPCCLTLSQHRGRLHVRSCSLLIGKESACGKREARTLFPASVSAVKRGY